MVEQGRALRFAVRRFVGLRFRFMVRRFEVLFAGLALSINGR